MWSSILGEGSSEIELLETLLRSDGILDKSLHFDRSDGLSNAVLGSPLTKKIDDEVSEPSGNECWVGVSGEVSFRVTTQAFR